MVFCISQENNHKLSDFISRIISILDTNQAINSVTMTSYIIHKSLNARTDDGIIDGLNIKLTLVVDGEANLPVDILRKIKIDCLRELNYNIIISSIKRRSLQEGRRNHSFIDDAEILYDKTGEISYYKLLYSVGKRSSEAVSYEPKLDIKRR